MATEHEHDALSPEALARLKALHEAAMRKALEELYALVKGECPSLLNEDSGGDADLDMRIKDAIKPVAPAQEEESNG